MPRTFRDYKPETRSLIHRLTSANCEIVEGDNGEETFKWEAGGLELFLGELLACDEANLYVRCPGETKLRRLWLVLGNSPGEIVCDYSACPLLDEITQAHYDAWEGKPQPTREEA